MPLREVIWSSHTSNAGMETIAGARLVPQRPHRDERGALVALEKNQGLPFDLKRVFYIYDVPRKLVRADHCVSAHMLLLPICGSLRVECDNGSETHIFEMDDRETGLHVEPGVLIRLRDFAPGTVLMVASSLPYASTQYATRPMYPGFEVH